MGCWGEEKEKRKCRNACVGETTPAETSPPPSSLHPETCQGVWRAHECAETNLELTDRRKRRKENLQNAECRTFENIYFCVKVIWRCFPNVHIHYADICWKIYYMYYVECSRMKITLTRNVLGQQHISILKLWCKPVYIICIHYAEHSILPSVRNILHRLTLC